MNTSTPVLAVEHVAKSYNGHYVLKDLTLNAKTSQCMALLGLNGAGKSTLLRILAGTLLPDQGDVTLCGKSLSENPLAAKQHIGYLPENAPSYPGMRVCEMLNFLAKLHGLGNNRQCREAADAVIEKCALTDVRLSMTDHLSKGYRHRLGLAQAIIHNPDIILLDEPTDGLDPAQKQCVRSLLRTLGKSHLVIISTHILEDVKEFCDSVAVLTRGTLAYHGDIPDSLSELFMK